jgi:hypothetical protein
MDLLREQCGIATRRQLYQMGMTPSELKARDAAGLWRFLNQLVVATHNGPLSRAEARWAAVLSAPGLVGLCALTAFEVHGVKGFDTDVVDIVVPRGHHVPTVEGVHVAVHESRRFSRLDVLPWLLPVVRVERAAERRRYLDAEFDLPLERLTVEIDVGVHLRLDKRWEDTAKDNDVAIARNLTLRFPSIAIYGDDPRAIQQLRDAIATCQR